MIRAGLIGLGKMGISHHAILNAHPEVDLVAVCDSSQYVLDVLNKYTGITTYSDYRKMIAECKLQAVVIATPSRFHAQMVRDALEAGLHVFCEKPFVLDLAEGQALAELADSRGLVNQVGYHYRHVGAFREAKRLLDAGALGKLHHVRAEASGPVVLRPSGSTWRSNRADGGGCLYDYASHAIDLVNMLVGTPTAVSGAVLNKVFSRDVDDEVYATLEFGDGLSGHLAANWSDESQRKMSTSVALWGTNGRMIADRQAVQFYLREPVGEPLNLRAGWTVRYTTDLTEPVWYYLRGEEYSHQIDHFVQCVLGRQKTNVSPFSSALEADRVIEAVIASSQTGRVPVGGAAPRRQPESRGFFGFSRKGRG